MIDFFVLICTIEQLCQFEPIKNKIAVHEKISIPELTVRLLSFVTEGSTLVGIDLGHRSSMALSKHIQDIEVIILATHTYLL